LIDRARLSRSDVKIYPRGDLDVLETLLKTGHAENRIVVTESVFSINSNITSLPQMQTLCEHCGAWLVVDDVHGRGEPGAEVRAAQLRRLGCSCMSITNGRNILRHASRLPLSRSSESMRLLRRQISQKSYAKAKPA
jgi:hypothetical protein